MPRFLILSAGLILLSQTGQSIRADQIQNYVATYSDSLGLNASAPLSLSDLTNGGSVVLGTLPVVGSLTPNSEQALNGTFDLGLSIRPPEGAPDQDPLHWDTLNIHGDFQGSLVPGGALGLSGGYTGSWINASGSTSDVTTASDANVAALHALFLHPERIHISAQVIAGPTSNDLLQTTLTVDPPELVLNPQPVPEPATFATFVLAFGGLFGRRLLHARSSRSPSPRRTG